MNWTPMLAQIELPTDLTQLGEVVIIAAALLGVVYAIRPLISGFVAAQKDLSAVNRELLLALKQSDRTQDASNEAIHEVKSALTTQTEALALLVKGQPEIIAQIVAQAQHVVVEVNGLSEKRDADLRAGIERIEAALAGLREDVSAGHRSTESMLG
jgi:hypothetical protein